MVDGQNNFKRRESHGDKGGKKWRKVSEPLGVVLERKGSDVPLTLSCTQYVPQGGPPEAPSPDFTSEVSNR